MTIAKAVHWFIYEADIVDDLLVPIISVTIVAALVVLCIGIVYLTIMGIYKLVKYIRACHNRKIFWRNKKG